MANKLDSDQKMRAFFEEIFDFVNLYCNEYAVESGVEFDWSDREDPLAEVSLMFPNGTWYIVPIRLDENGCAAIDIGDAGTLHLDGHGLYAFLFNEAEAKLRCLEARMERMTKNADRAEGVSSNA